MQRGFGDNLVQDGDMDLFAVLRDESELGDELSYEVDRILQNIERIKISTYEYVSGETKCYVSKCTFNVQPIVLQFC